MRVGDRSPGNIFRAIFDFRHYSTLIRYFFVFDKPFSYLLNYLLATGSYPKQILIKTKTGKVTVKLFSHHDMLTVNEIFCRDDYKAGEERSVVVDVGSNIGISALYFLTRNPENRVYLFEPNPMNIKRLEENMKPYSDRVEINEDAVAEKQGQFEFSIEESGRYGGLLSQTDQKIKVNCRNVNSVLEEILEKNDHIDILKFDTEGSEIPTINSIDKKFYPFLKVIYFEEGIPERLELIESHVFEYFSLNSSGNTYKLTPVKA